MLHAPTGAVLHFRKHTVSHDSCQALWGACQAMVPACTVCSLNVVVLACMKPPKVPLLGLGHL